MNLNEPVPNISFPSIVNYNIRSLDDDIVSLSNDGFIVDSQYYKQGIRGSYLDCYARKGVADRLHIAESLLPKGLRFKIYDAYRPICIQQSLWDYYRQDIKNKSPDLSDDELDIKTSFFVSKPSYDVRNPSLHNTGGAVDLTIITENGYALNMGTLFDDFTDRAWTNHFEIYTLNDEVQKNRRLLYNVMIKAGFTNLPSEWWHFDYGTKFWAYFNKTDALYEGILNINFPHRY